MVGRRAAGESEVVGERLRGGGAIGAEVHLVGQRPDQVSERAQDAAGGRPVSELDPIACATDRRPGEADVSIGQPQPIGDLKNGGGVGGVRVRQALLQVALAVAIRVAVRVAEAIGGFPGVRQAVRVGIRRRDDGKVHGGHRTVRLPVVGAEGEAVRAAIAVGRPISESAGDGIEIPEQAVSRRSVSLEGEGIAIGIAGQQHEVGRSIARQGAGQVGDGWRGVGRGRGKAPDRAGDGDARLVGHGHIPFISLARLQARPPTGAHVAGSHRQVGGQRDEGCGRARASRLHVVREVDLAILVGKVFSRHRGKGLDDHHVVAGREIVSAHEPVAAIGPALVILHERAHDPALIRVLPRPLPSDMAAQHQKQVRVALERVVEG